MNSCLETFPVTVLRHIFENNSTQFTNRMEKATMMSRAAKHLHSYGKKTGSQMDCETAALVKMPVNMA